jgi:hypothetical protein
MSGGDLVQSMTAHGYDKPEMIQAFKHLKEPCSHESGGDIGTLPSYPIGREWVDGTTKRDVRHTSQDCWDAIAAANVPSQYFNYCGGPAWVKASVHEQAFVEQITVPRMTHLLGEVGKWRLGDSTNSKARPCRPAKAVAEHMVAEPHPRLPWLRRLVRVPIFDSTGTLVMQPGYDAASGLFVARRGINIPGVMHAPTAKDVADALDLIYELVEDFPFVDDADRTNAIALLLLPFVRDLIAGPTPLHLLTKPSPGSGGTLLVQALLYPALGERSPTLSMPTSQVEWEYKMTSILMTGPTAIVFDNVRTVLDSDQLASALTAAVWQGRQIKTSNMPRCPITNVWAATGNNVKVSDENARRTLPIRLDAHTDRPFDRTGFRHPNLIAWAHEHRSRLIHAILTLGQAWVAEGMPKGSLVVGMFEDWSGAMSGIADVIGLPDLRANWTEWNETRPTDENDVRKVLRAWWAEFGARKVKAKDLLPVVGPLLHIDPGGGQSALTSLGMMLGKWQGRTVDGMEMVGQAVSGSMTWRLIPRASEAPVIHLVTNEEKDEQANT